MKTSIEVFKYTINPKHGKEDLQQGSNDKGDSDASFKPLQVFR